MAGDWIKMRSELNSHPKVVRILSATKSDKFRVIGGLHAVWCVFDAHSKDGTLFGYTPELLDHVIGWDGLSRALIAVGWLDFDGLETIALPEFDEHNSQSAKRRAEDQKRKRDARNCQQKAPDDCGQNADKMRTREEKRREDKNINTVTPPEGVSIKVWADFLKHRKTKKAAVTDTAIAGIRREAFKAGVTLEQAMITSIERGWVGFKADWYESGNPDKPNILAGAI